MSVPNATQRDCARAIVGILGRCPGAYAAKSQEELQQLSVPVLRALLAGLRHLDNKRPSQRDFINAMARGQLR